MAFDDSFLDELKARNDIEEVISAYVEDIVGFNFGFFDNDIKKGSLR